MYLIFKLIPCEIDVTADQIALVLEKTERSSTKEIVAVLSEVLACSLENCEQLVDFRHYICVIEFGCWLTRRSIGFLVI